MDSNDPSLSIIVVNKDDVRVADTLERLVEIEGESGAELIVVDASSRRLDDIRASYPTVEWLDYVHPSGKPRTIAEQRNVGLRQAKGDVIVFLDANCVPSEHWLRELLAPIEDDTEDIVVGAVTSRNSPTIHDHERRPGVDDKGYLSECSTMNLAVRRQVFDAVGTFDERLGFAEDVDFSWRAVDASFRLRYAPDAVVAHDWDSSQANFARAFRYGVARVRLYRKHRSRLRRLLGPDIDVAGYTMFLAFLPIALVFPAYLLLLAVPLVRNRRNQPVAAVTYHLCYAAGVLSELLHIPVLKGQRRRFSPRD